MEGQIVSSTQVWEDKRLLTIRKEDVGKNILILNPLGHGYLKISFESNEGWIPKNCIKVVNLYQFKGEKNSKQAEEMLVQTKDLFLFSFKPGSQNFFLTMKLQTNVFRHLQIKRKEGSTIYFVLGHAFKSINQIANYINSTSNIEQFFQTTKSSNDEIRVKVEGNLSVIEKIADSMKSERNCLLTEDRRNAMQLLESLDFIALGSDMTDLKTRKRKLVIIFNSHFKMSSQNVIEKEKENDYSSSDNCPSKDKHSQKKKETINEGELENLDTCVDNKSKNNENKINKKTITTSDKSSVFNDPLNDSLSQYGSSTQISSSNNLDMSPRSSRGNILDKTDSDDSESNTSLPSPQYVSKLKMSSQNVINKSKKKENISISSDSSSSNQNHTKKKLNKRTKPSEYLDDSDYNSREKTSNTDSKSTTDRSKQLDAMERVQALVRLPMPGMSGKKKVVTKGEKKQRCCGLCKQPGHTRQKCGYKN